MFVVIQFLEEDESFDFASKEWLVGRSYIMWPNVPLEKLKKLRSQHADPTAKYDFQWEKVAVRIVSTKGKEHANKSLIILILQIILLLDTHLYFNLFWIIRFVKFIIQILSKKS